MDYKDIFIAFSIPLGLVVGSFLNVLIYRLPRNLSIVKPPSSCTTCKATISWYDNIPILSYIALLGKCRKCKAGISLRYPFVEALTGAIFFITFYTQFNTNLIAIMKTALKVYLVSSMIVLTFIDFDFKILPDSITISGIVICILLCTAFPFLHYGEKIELGEPHVSALVTAIFSAFFGAMMIYLVGFFGELIFRKEAMGFGDVKYMAMLGAILGWKLIAMTFFLACLLGSVYGIIIFIFTKERYMAFGPFISLGAILLIFLHREILSLLRSIITGLR